MDLTTIITIISIIVTIIAILIEIIKKIRLSHVKKIWFEIFNRQYYVKIKGVKEYDLFSHDLKLIKRIILEKYPKTEIRTPKKNSMIVTIKEMQAPYKISFMPNYKSTGETLKIKITLEGTIKFSYRNTKSNKKNLNILDNLFTIIEEQHQIVPKFKWFSLEAYANELNDKPFKNDFKRISCEDTNIEIDKTNNFMKINSESINNIIDCLNSNIESII